MNLSSSICTQCLSVFTPIGGSSLLPSLIDPLNLKFRQNLQDFVYTYAVLFDKLKMRYPVDVNTKPIPHVNDKTNVS